VPPEISFRRRDCLLRSLPRRANALELRRILPDLEPLSIYGSDHRRVADRALSAANFMPQGMAAAPALPRPQPGKGGFLCRDAIRPLQKKVTLRANSARTTGTRSAHGKHS